MRNIITSWQYFAMKLPASRSDTEEVFMHYSTLRVGIVKVIPNAARRTLNRTSSMEQDNEHERLCRK